MGRIRHEAIVVTSPCVADVELAHDIAVRLGLKVTGYLTSNINQYYSLLIGPDGGKEGQHASDQGQFARDAWKAAVRERRQDFRILNWVHVVYGESPAPEVLDYDFKDEE